MNADGHSQLRKSVTSQWSGFTKGLMQSLVEEQGQTAKQILASLQESYEQNILVRKIGETLASDRIQNFLASFSEEDCPYPLPKTLDLNSERSVLGYLFAITGVLSSSSKIKYWFDGGGISEDVLLQFKVYQHP